MASSPSASRSDAASAPGTPPTPRSKLRALLAQVESSSDEASAPAKRVNKQETGNPSRTTANAPSAEPQANEDNNTSNDEAVLRPRGRLASRMLAGSNGKQNPGQVSHADARERVRRMLQMEQDESADKEIAGETKIADAGDSVDEDSVKSRPRKLLTRRHRSNTPETGDPQPGSSPGLFVSPAKSQSAENAAAGSESDGDLPSFKNERFLALVARKRKERLEKEAEEARKKASRLAAQQAIQDAMSGTEDDDSDIADDEGGLKLTQEARPARKASKKAMEEMNRETQRMTRSLQLAHEAKTRKKVTKAALFERFNFKVEQGPVEQKLPSSSRPATPTSAHQTDAEMKDAETPPSSPPAVGKDLDLTKNTQSIEARGEQEVSGALNEGEDEEIPTFNVALDRAMRELFNKPKGKAPAADVEADKPTKAPADKPNLPAKPRFRVKLPEVHADLVTLDSDDELEITTKNNKVDAILARAPRTKTRESRSMHALRTLAHLDSPEKKAASRNEKAAMTAGQLQASLQQRARAQAKLERDRRLELLRAKGVHVQTAEEREREMAEVEDIVAKARREAEEIMQREKEAAKKEKRDAGEVDPLAWDDSEDESDEYQEPEEIEDIELSGSDEEAEDEGSDNDGDEVEDENSDKDSAAGALFDDEAGSGGESEDGDPEEEVDDADIEDEDEAPAPRKNRSRQTRKQVTILSDDENDETVEATPRPKVIFPKSPAPNSDSPVVPTSVLRSATKTFIPGLPVAGPAGLGLTQIFAGTMDSQFDPQAGSPDVPMPSFDPFPDSNFSQTTAGYGEDAVLNSQLQDTHIPATQAEETQGVKIDFAQTQVHGFDSLLRNEEATPMTELRELMSDQDCEKVPDSTINTVIPRPTAAAGASQDSPLVSRGRFRRRADLTQAFEEDKDMEDSTAAVDDLETDEFGFGTTAFSVMQAAVAKEKKRKAMEAFNKKRSKAKEMVEEQAEESEDEYAGLGGADGEDSSDDDAGSVKEMIDDEGAPSATDDAKLAAFYADRERAQDEKQVEKLFHDITRGMLRRKRGADYDLSDSDDGGEARRRLKRRQFAKMQKALFADERIEKIAEDPRNAAFLRTIEDRGSDDEMDFIFESPTTTAQVQAIPDSQPEGTGPPAQSHNSTASSRPPAALRRTKGGRKPANLGEVRESLSNLLEEPNASMVPATEFGSSGESDADDESRRRPSRSPRSSTADSNKENRRPAVIDRISLKRNASSSSNASASSAAGPTAAQQGRLAFAAPALSAGGFKVPALLRRATTNSLVSSASSGSGASSGASAGAGGGGSGLGEEGKIKRNAGKRSGVNYFARENERRAALAEADRRREARKWRGVEGRGKVVGGLFGGGKFE